MASSLSLSQSIHSSLILQHYYHERQLKDQGRSAVVINGTQTTCQRQIGLSKQILLTAIFFGISCTLEFESLYSVISLQYFGLPVALVSIPGLVSGTTSIFILPLLGHMSDKGPNPTIRKLAVQGLSIALFLVGLTSLATCSWVKAQELANWTEASGVNVNVTPNNLHTSTMTERPYTTINATTVISTPPSESSHVAPLAYVAMVTFICFESGFDLSMSTTRANILEVVPAKQTTRILTTATSMSSFAGLFVAVIGIVNFPKILGPLLDMDGYAMTLMLMSIISGLLLVITTYSSIRITLKLHREKTTNGSAERQPLIQDDTDTMSENGMDISHRSLTMSEDGNCIESKRRNDYGAMHENDHMLPFSSSQTMSIDFSTPSHLDNKDIGTFDNLKGMGTWISRDSMSQSITRSDAIYGNGDSNQETPQHSSSVNYYKQELSQKAMSNSLSLTMMKESESLPRDLENESYHNLKDGQNQGREILSLSGSVSSSKTGEKALGQLHLQKFKDNLKRQNDGEPRKPSSPFRNRRLFVCIIQTFFSFGCVYTVTGYHANTLTLEVYKGDPLALPGTPGKELYELAVRTSSFGLLTACFSFFLACTLITRLIDRIGPLAVLMASHVVTSVATVSFISFSDVISYFGMMLAHGANKAIVYTVPYVLGALYMSSDPADGVQEPELSQDSMGKMTSTIGVALPVASIFLSSLMGPLITATGSAWVPMYYSVVMATASVMAGGILIFLSNYLRSP